MWIGTIFNRARSDPLESRSMAVRVPAIGFSPGPLAAIDKNAAAHDSPVTTRAVEGFRSLCAELLDISIAFLPAAAGQYLSCGRYWINRPTA